MDDLKSLTVSYLRELARKHLGSGYSKLTKKELIAALARFVPALKKLARASGIELPAIAAKTASQRSPATAKPPRGQAPKEPARKPEKKVPEKKAPPPKPEKKAAEKKPAAKKAATPQAPKSGGRRPPASAPEVTERLPKPAQVVNFPPRSRSARPIEEPAPEELVGSGGAAAAPEQHPAEPLVEGFFVARMVGERELRRHHLTEDQSPSWTVSGPPGYDENLGELPLDYGNDLALALARDPHTLFVTWDFSALTRSRALEGLGEAQAYLRVFEGEKLVREEEFALESRSFYIHNLPPGRPYRVEAHFVGRDGRSRRLGHSAHRVTLPQTGPSPDKTVRFMRMPPPPLPTRTVPAEVVAAPPPTPAPAFEEREYITWHRVQLPGSAGMQDVPETRRERIPGVPPGVGPGPSHLDVTARPLGSSEQRPGVPEQRPGGPPLPPGAPSRHLDISARPLGSSEQYLEIASRSSGSSELRPEITTRPPASPEQYLEITSRPLGSSEQSAGRDGARAGSSEQPHWTPPPSGRGR